MDIKGFKSKDGTVHKYDYGALANVPQGGGAGTPDWNAPEGQIGHVLNRTHYAETVMGVLLSGTAAADGYPLASRIGLQVGKAYVVNWGGTDYEVTAQTITDNGIDMIYIGNPAAFGGADSGEPFIAAEYVSDAVAAEQGVYGACIPLDGSESMEFAVSGETEVVYPLDPKFLGAMRGQRKIDITIGEDWAAITNFDFETAWGMDAAELQSCMIVHNGESILSVINVEKTEGYAGAETSRVIQFQIQPYADDGVQDNCIRRYSWGTADGVSSTISHSSGNDATFVPVPALGTGLRLLRSNNGSLEWVNDSEYASGSPDSGGNADQSSLSATASELLITILRNGVYSVDQSANITALATELGVTEEEEPDAPVVPDEPEVTLSSISATYSGGDVAVGTSVTDLTGIVVTAHYSDGSTETVTGYTLSGTIAEGSNTVTVSYGGKTTTFVVNGVTESSEPVEMLAGVSPNGGSFNWYTDDGATAYSGSITTRNPIRGIASADVFDTDTTVRVNISATTQTYDYFVMASTDWDGIAVGGVSTKSNNFNCVEVGAKTWVDNGVSYQIIVTVKAGQRLGVYSFTSTFGSPVSVSVEVV